MISEKFNDYFVNVIILVFENSLFVEQNWIFVNKITYGAPYHWKHDDNQVIISMSLVW